MAATADNDSNHRSEVSKWIHEVFKKHNFKKIDVEMTGSSEKGDGYVGDIAFVVATAITSNEETKQFNLVIKYGKQSKDLREKIPVRLIFAREIFVYDTVVPIFQRFEQERNVNVLNEFMPKCFGSILYDNQEVLALQNLKALGYDLHDRCQPLDINHLKLTFENYGRWHGLSIAYRDQAPEQFNKLFTNLENILEAVFSTQQKPIKKAEEILYSVLEKNKEFELLARLRRRFQGGFIQKLLELFKVQEPYSTFYHGDCWNNNMMFLYDRSDRTQPKAMKLLDFQVANLGPPVYDLSYHLYSTASEKELQQFIDLLQLYHSSLSKTIKSLGSDPEKLFPYSELVRQWKEYSYYGLILGTYVIPAVLADKEDAMDIQDMDTDGGSLDKMAESVMRKNFEKLSERSIAVVKHFVEFLDS